VKRFVVLTVALLILASLSFAGGRFSNLPQTRFQAPQMPAYRQCIVPRYQAKQQLTYQEMFKEMNLTKEQAQRILAVIKDANAKLEELQKQYKELYENAKNMSVYEFRTKVRELNQKRAEIIQQMREEIEKTINVEQLQRLMQTYRLRRIEMFTKPKLGFRGPAFLDEDFIDALEEYAK
jgi:Spy/CpxP family protein refolding chaperone